jgi:putative SOS response-associated peptidase YedK
MSSAWNMAPSQCSYIYRNEPWGRRFVSLYWGLLPFWAKEPKGLQPINAQSETAHEKPMFRKLVRERRCLVAADGFYEWVKTSTGKVPHYITHAGADPIFFTGLWDCWREGKEDPRPTFTIMTTRPNELMEKIHTRMPVIVRPEHYELWMDQDVKDPAVLAPVSEPFPAEEMRAWPVSPRVNTPKNNDETLLEPVPLAREPGCDDE